MVDSQAFPDGSQHGEWRIPFLAREDGWLAARVSSQRRDSFYQPIFAHTSPIWLHLDNPSVVRSSSAAFFVKSLDEAMDWVRSTGKFNTEQQQAEVHDLFRAARRSYRRLV